MAYKIFIDSNAWDVFFNLGMNLIDELPSTEFSLSITREAEFEIAAMPAEKRDYVSKQLASGGIETDVFFGFAEEGVGQGEHRTEGFGDLNEADVGGRFIELDESTFIESEIIGPAVRPTGLLKNEADVSLAARSLRSVVLTCDDKGPLKRVRVTHGGMVLDLKKFQAGSSLAAFIRAETAS